MPETRAEDAQAGDALIKLAVYRANAHQTAAERCAKLQQIESDARLADVYDRWRARDEPDLGVFGPELGRKAKATVVEAMIWRRHAAAVHTLAGELDALLDAISR